MFKYRSLILVAFWVFAVTVEAQVAGNYPQPAGPGMVPWYSPDEHLYTPPDVPRGSPGLYRSPEVLMPRHPDDGLPSEAPYISVPVQPSYGYQPYYAPGYGY